VKAQGLEGLVAKRRGGVYEPGQRSGSWQKMRVNPGAGIRDRRLYAERPEFRRAHYRILRKRETVLRRPHYAGRTRNGFAPPLRVELIKRLRRLRTETSRSPIFRR
jgi:ATP-dependent DNA ligase